MDYYVDALNGDDAHDGRTPETAWKTMAHGLLRDDLHFVGGTVEQHAVYGTVSQSTRVFFKRGQAFIFDFMLSMQAYEDWQRQERAFFLGFSGEDE